MDGKLIWITGLAGSGKTTIAKELYSQILKTNKNVVHLDGDMLRTILGGNYGHTIADRKATAGIYIRLCSALTKQGIIVIMSTISLFHEVHAFNRANNKNYYEILLESDHDLRKERVEKDETRIAMRREFYKKQENVMGVDQIPELPLTPTLVLPNNDKQHVKENVEKILQVIGLGK